MPPAVVLVSSYVLYGSSCLCPALPATPARELHQRYKGRKGMSAQQLAAGVWICRPCHSAVHRAEDNRALAESYNTLEALKAHPQVARFAEWARGQRVAPVTAAGGRQLKLPR